MASPNPSLITSLGNFFAAAAFCGFFVNLTRLAAGSLTNWNITNHEIMADCKKNMEWLSGIPVSGGDENQVRDLGLVRP